jgi:hypothetical protein
MTMALQPVATATGNTTQQSARPGPQLFVGLVSVRVMTGTETWDNTYKNIQRLDPNGARTIKLPPEQEGLWFKIINFADAAETITIQDDAAGAVETCDQNEAIELYCDGTSWFVLAIYTIAIT